jgi:hypothetical protein
LPPKSNRVKEGQHRDHTLLLNCTICDGSDGAAMPRLRELGRNGKTNYVTTNLHRVRKKRESSWQRRDRVEEGKEFGKTMEHSTTKTDGKSGGEKKGNEHEGGGAGRREGL